MGSLPTGAHWKRHKALVTVNAAVLWCKLRATGAALNNRHSQWELWGSGKQAGKMFWKWGHLKAAGRVECAKDVRSSSSIVWDLTPLFLMFLLLYIWLLLLAVLKMTRGTEWGGTQPLTHTARNLFTSGFAASPVLRIVAFYLKYKYYKK